MAEPTPLHPLEGTGALVRSEPLDVESRAVALARSGAPLRRALAAIAGRLVASRGWERLGSTRAGDYLAERAGLSARQVYELAHVDAALARLPRIEAAFVAGRLGWTKVRLLARVATPANEAVCLDLAQRLTVAELSRQVRAVDRRSAEAGAVGAVDGGPGRTTETVFVEASGPGRARWYRACWLARRVAGEHLPVWACAEAIAAEVLSALPLELGPAREVEARDPDGAEASPPEPWEAGAAARLAPVANGCEPDAARDDAPGDDSVESAPPPFLRSLLDGLDDADPFELDARLRRAVRLEQRLEAELGPLLLEVARRSAHRAYGFGSVAAFAREWLGICPRKAQALLRLERAFVACPELRDAYRTGALSWVQAHALVPILLLDEERRFHRAWLAHAKGVSVRRLEDDVDRALATGELDPRALGEESPAPKSDPQTRAEDTAGGRDVTPSAFLASLYRFPYRFHFNAPRDVARLFRATLATVQRRIERRVGRTASEAEAFDAMLEHVFEVWGRAEEDVPAAHRVFARDGWRCTVPGCTSYRNLHDHHVVFRSAGGSNDLGNRTTLCAWHHLRGVHRGVVRVTGRAPGRLRFELGVRRGRHPLATYRSGDRVA